VYCPKTLAGLNELPGTLASRAIPIKMKPPRPEEHYEELADEDLEVESQAEILRITLQSWADEAGDVLRDPRRKPAKLPGLNARGNQIWRILFRIADQAGGDWPARARRAALELSGIAARHEDASVGVRLLGHIRDVFDADRMTCSDLANALNADEEMPYGAWNDGKGISTRELGRKLAPYEVKASSTRIGDARGNGYRRGQFEDVWARYLAEPGEPNRDTVTTRMAQSKKDGQEPGQLRPVTVPEGGVNPDEHSGVTVVTVEGESGVPDERELDRLSAVGAELGLLQ
jgi:hypothetical protein